MLSEPYRQKARPGAEALSADLIVSGDRKDLLPLGSHQGIGIVTVVQALATLGAAPGAGLKI